MDSFRRKPIKVEIANPVCVADFEKRAYKSFLEVCKPYDRIFLDTREDGSVIIKALETVGC